VQRVGRPVATLKLLAGAAWAEVIAARNSAGFAARNSAGFLFSCTIRASCRNRPLISAEASYCLDNRNYASGTKEGDQQEVILGAVNLAAGLRDNPEKASDRLGAD
jgi:hypothetical protein